MKILGAVSKKDWAEKIRKDLPVLLISGSEDPVGGLTKGVSEVYDKLKNAGIEKLDLKFVDGKRHEILNEDNKAETYDFVLNWCKAAVGI